MIRDFQKSTSGSIPKSRRKKIFFSIKSLEHHHEYLYILTRIYHRVTPPIAHYFLTHPNNALPYILGVYAKKRTEDIESSGSRWCRRYEDRTRPRQPAAVSLSASHEESSHRRPGSVKDHQT